MEGLSGIYTKKNRKRNTVRIREQEGQGHHTEKLITEDEMEYVSIDYAGLFYTHLAHRESCFSCQFADIYRCSDITIGGYLDYGKKGIKDNLGVSMCFLNSEKGKYIFENILNSINSEKKEITKVLRRVVPNMGLWKYCIKYLSPTQSPPVRPLEKSYLRNAS